MPRARASTSRTRSSSVTAERALVIYGWTIADGWEDPHDLDVAVSLIGGDGSVTTHGERLRFWPFTAGELGGRSAGRRADPGNEHLRVPASSGTW